MRGLFRVAMFVLASAAWATTQSDSSGANGSTHFRSALAFEQRGEMDNAIHEYQEALKQTPNHADSHYNLARLLAAKQDYDGAILSISRSDSDQAR